MIQKTSEGYRDFYCNDSSPLHDVSLFKSVDSIEFWVRIITWDHMVFFIHFLRQENKWKGGSCFCNLHVGPQAAMHRTRVEVLFRRSSLNPSKWNINGSILANSCSANVATHLARWYDLWQFPGVLCVKTDGSIWNSLSEKRKSVFSLQCTPRQLSAHFSIQWVWLTTLISTCL